MLTRRITSSVVGAALLATSVAGAQERTAMLVSVGGTALPVDVQPRVIVEQQRGVADQALIKVTGTLWLAYASTIVPGDWVDILAVDLNGISMSIFGGPVASLDPGVDQVQPFVVIRATSPSPRVEAPSQAAVTITPGPGGGARLVAFVPHLSASSSIQEVIVTGVDASTGAPITGHAVAPTILLGPGSDGAFGTVVNVETDRRFSSTSEADAFARSALSELLADRISAEVLTDASPDLKVGNFVEIEGIDEEFEGAYYVAGVRHEFGSDSYGGYSSAFRLRRADLGMFRVPSIDDEVLVAFEQGDLSRPYVVDSWWDCDSSERSRDTDQCRLLRWPW